MPRTPPDVPKTIEEALVALGRDEVPVMGGTGPGHTTDAVAALLAERWVAARLVIATNVDGIYDRDPRHHEDAERQEVMDHDQLLQLAVRSKQGAGTNTIVDLLASTILHRSRIELDVLDGTSLGDLEAALLGEPYHGTRVTSEQKP